MSERAPGTAAGYLLDHALVGVGEARLRVLARWTSGCALHALDADRWVLVLGLAEPLDKAALPGLPLTSVTAEAVSYRDGGLDVVRPRSELPPVDPAAWLDLADLDVVLLTPVQPPPPPVTPPERLLAAPRTDLRRAAALGGPRPAARAAADSLRQAVPARGRRGSGSMAAAPRPPRDGLARLLLRTPVAHQVARRQQRFLQQLTEAFERGAYDDALRDAIALGGLPGHLRLRAAVRRERLDPGSSSRTTGGGLPVGDLVHEHLRALYRRAAEDLERQGRIEESAFALADLLGSPREAVALLERHGRSRVAAELAETTGLDAATVVRLWWRAGEHDRAVDVARATGAFAAAITRLQDVDADAAEQLRTLWAADLSRSGDHLGAVHAAWPSPRLRARTGHDIAAGIGLGGTTAAHLFAHQLALVSSKAGLDAALALLTQDDAELQPARLTFLTALTDLPVADPAADRRLSSAALRLVQGPGPLPLDPGTQRRLRTALRERADPLLREDLGPAQRSTRAAPAGGWTATFSAAPGPALVLDAAPVRGGTVLVAAGAAGLHLLGPNGAPRTRWDLHCHQVCVSHHGGSAVVAVDLGQGTWELHRLDLASRRLERWIVVRARALAPDHDGATLVLVDLEGTLVHLDVHHPGAKVLWTELADGAEALVTAAAPGTSAALVRPVLPSGRGAPLELWQWEQPARTLRRRDGVPDPEHLMRAVVLADGTLFGVWAGDDGSLHLRSRGRTDSERRLDADLDAVQLLSTGAGAAWTCTTQDGTRLELLTRDLARPSLVLQAPDSGNVQLRATTEHGVAWDDQGRLLLLNLAQESVRSHASIAMWA